MAKRFILVVDDNPNMASLLAEMLEMLDVPSKVATNGESALKLIEDEDFTLVITDLKMPQMSGTELLTAIKSKQPDLPVVVISGYAVKSNEGQVVRGLADGFVSKPFKMADIESVVQLYS